MLGVSKRKIKQLYEILNKTDFKTKIAIRDNDDTQLGDN